MEEYVRLLKELNLVIAIADSSADYEFKCKSIMNKYYRCILPRLDDLNLSIDFNESSYSTFKDTVDNFITRIMHLKNNVQAILPPSEDLK